MIIKPNNWHPNYIRWRLYITKGSLNPEAHIDIIQSNLLQENTGELTQEAILENTWVGVYHYHIGEMSEITEHLTIDQWNNERKQVCWLAPVRHLKNRLWWEQQEKLPWWKQYQRLKSTSQCIFYMWIWWLNCAAIYTIFDKNINREIGYLYYFLVILWFICWLNFSNYNWPNGEKTKHNSSLNTNQRHIYGR